MKQQHLEYNVITIQLGWNRNIKKDGVWKSTCFTKYTEEKTRSSSFTLVYFISTSSEELKNVKTFTFISLVLLRKIHTEVSLKTERVYKPCKPNINHYTHSHQQASTPTLPHLDFNSIPTDLHVFDDLLHSLLFQQGDGAATEPPTRHPGAKNSLWLHLHGCFHKKVQFFAGNLVIIPGCW